ncbi:glutamyl-trna amidotransferase [Phaffia rhodozyma]|uniref:Glutamyl-tRNA(Gln) amidotransferase subunit B, mitochondrial n=1 Tax=Phaffia rhodozyma TaxID=264483 RepID=A0A0F7SKD6_PHARH|nr:glutamyl-trna amidotransferase [Phaffia rhodozyma]
MRLIGWETVIGLELHIQFRSSKKLFSASKTVWDSSPNTNVSVLDLGYPGTLPILSPGPVELALQTALALGCTIPPRSMFDRKHYHYHDQPLGYQITQHYHPLALRGSLAIPTKPPKEIRIQQIQLEQDTAKTLGSLTNPNHSLIDFNRAGVGLMEVVTEPDLRSAEDAGAFVKTIRGVLRRIGASDADMEKGSLRVDCNVSINRIGEPPGTRVEIKNLASVQKLTLAVESEIKRHRALLESGNKVLQETRGWDEGVQGTVALRGKESLKDYRYMPDGNLPVLQIDPAYIQSLQETLPVLPLQLLAKLREEYPTVPLSDLETLLGLDPEFYSGVTYFKDLVKKRSCIDSDAKTKDNSEHKQGEGRDPKTCSNWIINELLGEMRSQGKEWPSGSDLEPSMSAGVSVEEMGKLIDLLGERKLSAPSAKTLLHHLVKSPPSPSRVSVLIQKHDLISPVLTPASIRLALSALISSHPDLAETIKSRQKPAVLMKLVGLAREAFGGKVGLDGVKEELEDLLDVKGVLERFLEEKKKRKESSGKRKRGGGADA